MTSNENNAKPSKKEKKQKPKVKVFTKKKKRNEPESEFIKKLQEKYTTIDTANVKTFVDLPLSPKTLKGLKESGYLKPTEIQRDCIGLSLQGKDVLGAAQTGSGKTLAFIIPILEKLYCMQWSRYDGVGSLVITPTRELAYQIFEALRRVGQHHDFSAGLIIGGKDLKFERNRMDQCNIVICTPGRLLQHMDENPLFDCTNMQILVLDEADRCLDMGFQQTMNAVIANLPPQRQTLLFSATQTKSVKDLARLSLKDPSYVSVHEHAKFSTPAGLEQSYMVCELHEKMSVLWSFIKNHLKKKTIIFFSTCKQVKYTYDMFCKLRPGVSLLALYGTLHQLRRMDIYEEFCRKQSAVLFATDLVARGLDFPEVHWVVQADCPEDPETYIHRVGRTARYHRGGESLLLLQPSELAMLDKLKDKKIPINKIDINQDRLKNPVQKMEAFLVSTPGLKDVAQRAFVNYVKSVFLMKDKEVFKVDEIDTVEYAKSLGLTNPPRVRFIERMNKAQDAKESKTTPINSAPRENKIVKFDNSDDEEEEDEDEGFSGEQKKATISGFNISDDESDDDFLAVERRDNDIELPTEMEMVQQEMGRSIKGKPITKAAVAKKMLRKLNVVPNKKITFDAEGEAVVETTKKMQSELAQEYENEDYGGIDIEKAMLVRKEEDKFDKLLFKEKVKAMKREKKKKLKAKKSGEDEEERDDFGEDSDDAPDLSWLPDPDKIYGRKNSSDEGDNQDDDDIAIDDSGNDEEAREVVKEKRKKSKKRKQVDQKVQEKPKKKKKKLEKGVSESLTVNEAEELAMLLLRNK